MTCHHLHRPRQPSASCLLSINNIYVYCCVVSPYILRSLWLLYHMHEKDYNRTSPLIGHESLQWWNSSTHWPINVFKFSTRNQEKLPVSTIQWMSTVWHVKQIIAVSEHVILPLWIYKHFSVNITVNNVNLAARDPDVTAEFTHGRAVGVVGAAVGGTGTGWIFLMASNILL